MSDEPPVVPEEEPGPEGRPGPPDPSLRIQPPPPPATPRPVQPPAAKVRRQPTIEVIDPRHPTAEATVIGWGLGVVSLTDTELVLDQEADEVPQVADVTDRLIVRTDNNELHIVWPDTVERLYEDGA